MADKALVAQAYAEVRADLTKLPADLKQVPSFIKRLVSVEGLKAVRELVTGNVSSGLASLATRSYALQAEKLAALSAAAKEAAKDASDEAKAHEENARALDREAAKAEESARRKADASRQAAEAEAKSKAASGQGAESAGKAGVARQGIKDLTDEMRASAQRAAALNTEANAWRKVAEDTSRSTLARSIAADKAERLREESQALVSKNGGLKSQIEVLQSEAKIHEQMASKLFREADAWEKLAQKKAAEGKDVASAQEKAERLRKAAGDASGLATSARQSADSKKAMAERLAQESSAAAKAGVSLGGKVQIAAQFGIMAIKAVAAVAAAYFATTVAAAHKASGDLRTAQLVKSVGQAAGWSAEQLQHMAGELRKTTQFSGAQIGQAQQALLKHPNIHGEQFSKALRTATNLAAVMGTELPQAAAELGEILADPMKAADGALEKYGVLLNQVQQGQIKNAIAARDWKKAQELILGYLQRFNGAAEEAAQTGTGGFEKLKNSVLAAAQQVGGMNGDIGKLAARVADAIDKFMSLTVVKDLLDLSTAGWRALSGVVSSFIEGNGSDIQKWGEQVSEIYHNVRDQVLETWEAFKTAAKEALDTVLGATGTSWAEIKAVVTAVLDEISLLTTNFGLTAKYVWVGIKLGAQELWDGLRDGIAMVAASFEAAWKSIARGAEAAWDNIKSYFTGEGGGKSIADEMAKGWREGLESGMKRYNIGESPAAKELKQQLADLRGQMEAERDKIRKKREDEAKRKEDEKKKLETPGKEGPYINTKKFQFEFTGFEELSKKIQGQLYPSEAIQLQRAGVAAAENAVNNGKDGNKILGEIKDAIKGGLGFAP